MILPEKPIRTRTDLENFHNHLCEMESTAKTDEEWNEILEALAFVEYALVAADLKYEQFLLKYLPFFTDLN